MELFDALVQNDGRGILDAARDGDRRGDTEPHDHDRKGNLGMIMRAGTSWRFMPSGALPKMDFSAMPVRAKYTPVRPMATSTTTQMGPDWTPATKVRNLGDEQGERRKAASASRATMVSAAVMGAISTTPLILFRSRVW